MATGARPSKAQQQTTVGEGLAVGCLALGVVGVTTEKMAVEFAFRKAWRSWAYAVRFPVINAGPSRDDIVHVIGDSAERRSPYAAAWEATLPSPTSDTRRGAWRRPASSSPSTRACRSRHGATSRGRSSRTSARGRSGTSQGLGHHEERQHRSDDEQHRRARHEGVGEAFLLGVQPGSDETPELGEPDRAGAQHPGGGPDLETQRELLERRGREQAAVTCRPQRHPGAFGQRAVGAGEESPPATAARTALRCTRRTRAASRPRPPPRRSPGAGAARRCAGRGVMEPSGLARRRARGRRRRAREPEDVIDAATRSGRRARTGGRRSGGRTLPAGVPVARPGDTRVGLPVGAGLGLPVGAGGARAQSVGRTGPGVLDRCA